MGLSIGKAFNLAEVIAILRELESRGDFYGHSTLDWQASKVVLYHEHSSRKPSIKTQEGKPMKYG